MFQNSSSITIPMNSLNANKIYTLIVQVRDTLTNLNSEHAIKLDTKSGSVLHVKIESVFNKHGYIDYSKPALFICTADVNGVNIAINNATYSWIIRDLDGNTIPLSAGYIVMNSLRLPERILNIDTFYSVEVTVTYLNHIENVFTIYNTEIDTDFSFEVEPMTGVAYDTEFIVSAITQSIDSEISELTFGYMEGK